MADYSQIDLRSLAARQSGDPKLIAAFASGDDLYRLVASWLLEKPVAEITADGRSATKMINYGIVYGIGAKALYEQIQADPRITRKWSQEAVTALLRKWNAKFRGITTWKARNLKKAKTEGFIASPMGRIRTWDGAVSPTEAANYPVQAGSAETMMAALALVYPRLRQEVPKMRLVACVHDELVVETPAEAADRTRSVVVEAMELGMRVVYPGASLTNLVSVKVADFWIKDSSC